MTTDTNQAAPTLSFKVTPADGVLIAKIVDRTLRIIAAEECLTAPDDPDRRVNLLMDLSACHASGNPLRLADLLAADDFNVMHDVGGISRHIDHETGQLRNCFLPRFRQPKSAPLRHSAGIITLKRMGDFYEAFNDDAKIVARVLSITLTTRRIGGSDPMPMCGIPAHALARDTVALQDAGFTVITA